MEVVVVVVVVAPFSGIASNASFSCILSSASRNKERQLGLTVVGINYRHPVILVVDQRN